MSERQAQFEKEQVAEAQSGEWARVKQQVETRKALAAKFAGEATPGVTTQSPTSAQIIDPRTSKRKQAQLWAGWTDGTHRNQDPAQLRPSAMAKTRLDAARVEMEAERAVQQPTQARAEESPAVPRRRQAMSDTRTLEALTAHQGTQQKVKLHKGGN
jgi:hypothetical protein